MADESLVVRPKQVGRRIKLLRKYGLGLSGTDFAAQILGVVDTSLTSKIENGKVTSKRLEQIIAKAPGQAALSKTSEAEVRAFLSGVIDELPLTLSADIQLIEGRKRKSPDTASSAANGYFRHVRPDQGRRILASSSPRRNARYAA